MAFPKKISELPISGPLSNADLLAIVSGGVTSQTTLGNIVGVFSGGSSTLQDVLNMGSVASVATSIDITTSGNIN